MTTVANKTALIVDDDALQRALLESFLQQRGFTCTIAADGHEAKSALAACYDGFDLIICDLNMPHFDGVEYLLHLKEQKFGGALIICSGAAVPVVQSAKTLASAYGLNYLGFTRKPVNFGELGALVARVG